jgi:hypothetical protein
VSADSAQDVYGVVLDPETGEVDHAATERRRSALADSDAAAARLASGEQEGSK